MNIKYYYMNEIFIVKKLIINYITVTEMFVDSIIKNVLNKNF